MNSDIEQRLQTLERKLRWRSRILVAGALLVGLVAAAPSVSATRSLVVDSVTVTSKDGRVTIADGVITLEHDEQRTEVRPDGLHARNTRTGEFLGVDSAAVGLGNRDKRRANLSLSGLLLETDPASPISARFSRKGVFITGEGKYNDLSLSYTDGLQMTSVEANGGSTKVSLTDHALSKTLFITDGGVRTILLDLDNMRTNNIGPARVR